MKVSIEPRGDPLEIESSFHISGSHVFVGIRKQVVNAHGDQRKRHGLKEYSPALFVIDKIKHRID